MPNLRERPKIASYLRILPADEPGLTPPARCLHKLEGGRVAVPGKQGMSVRQLSAVVGPGEPADMVYDSFLEYYFELARRGEDVALLLLGGPVGGSVDIPEAVRFVYHTHDCGHTRPSVLGRLLAALSRPLPGTAGPSVVSLSCELTAYPGRNEEVTVLPRQYLTRRAISTVLCPAALSECAHCPSRLSVRATITSACGVYSASPEILVFILPHLEYEPRAWDGRALHAAQPGRDGFPEAGVAAPAPRPEDPFGLATARAAARYNASRHGPSPPAARLADRIKEGKCSRCYQRYGDAQVLYNGAACASRARGSAPRRDGVCSGVTQTFRRVRPFQNCVPAFAELSQALYVLGSQAGGYWQASSSFSRALRPCFNGRRTTALLGIVAEDCGWMLEARRILAALASANRAAHLQGWCGATEAPRMMRIEAQEYEFLRAAAERGVRLQEELEGLKREMALLDSRSGAQTRALQARVARLGEEEARASLERTRLQGLLAVSARRDKELASLEREVLNYCNGRCDSACLTGPRGPCVCPPQLRGAGGSRAGVEGGEAEGIAAGVPLGSGERLEHLRQIEQAELADPVERAGRAGRRRQRRADPRGSSRGDSRGDSQCDSLDGAEHTSLADEAELVESLMELDDQFAQAAPGPIGGAERSGRSERRERDESGQYLPYDRSWRAGRLEDNGPVDTRSDLDELGSRGSDL